MEMLNELADAVPFASVVIVGVCCFVGIIWFLEEDKKNSLGRMIFGASLELVSIAIFLQGDVPTALILIAQGALIVWSGIYPHSKSDVAEKHFALFQLVCTLLLIGDVWRAIRYLPLEENSTQNVSHFFLLIFGAIWYAVELGYSQLSKKK